VRRILLAGLLCLAFSESVALAGRTRFGWIHDTETLPQRGVELETWLVEEDGEAYGSGPRRDANLIWWGPVIGLTDRLELALPLELEASGRGMRQATSVSRFGAELRWRLGDPDPVASGPVAGLVRVAVKRMLVDRDGAHFEAGAVVSANAGRFHFAADLEGVAEVGEGETTYSLRPGAGVSARIVGDLAVGAEVYAEIGFADPEAADALAIGPNLAWTYGRFWLAASFPIGLLHIDAAPRLNWAVAF
jgi:hypothetical protein